MGKYLGKYAAIGTKRKTIEWEKFSNIWFPRWIDMISWRLYFIIIVGFWSEFLPQTYFDDEHYAYILIFILFCI